MDLVQVYTSPDSLIFLLYVIEAWLHLVLSLVHVVACEMDNRALFGRGALGSSALCSKGICELCMPVCRNIHIALSFAPFRKVDSSLPSGYGNCPVNLFIIAVQSGM